MALRSLITSFNGWTNDEQAEAFLKHMLGGDADFKAPKSATAVSNMSVAELKAECKRLGIRGVNGKKKDELKEKIAAFDPNAAPKKTKKDKTKEVILPDGFVKSEFAENFDAWSESDAANCLTMKRVLKEQVFNVTATQEMIDDELVNPEQKVGALVSSFKLNKEQLQGILKIHFRDLDIEALRAKEEAESSGSELSDTSVGSESEEDASVEDVTPPAKKKVPEVAAKSTKKKPSPKAKKIATAADTDEVAAKAADTSDEEETSYAQLLARSGEDAEKVEKKKAKKAAKKAAKKEAEIRKTKSAVTTFQAEDTDDEDLTAPVKWSKVTGVEEALTPDDDDDDDE